METGGVSTATRMISFQEIHEFLVLNKNMICETYHEIILLADLFIVIKAEEVSEFFRKGSCNKYSAGGSKTNGQTYVG